MAEFPTAFRGYDRDEVDVFVGRIEGTLGRAQLFAPPVTAAEVSDVRFAVTLRGYRARAVEEALETYLRELEGAQRRRRIRAAEADRLAGIVRNVRFATTRLSEGYDEAHVDAFLDRIVGALRARRLRPADVRAARFGTTRLRRGYGQQEVDGFLEYLATELERLA